LHESPPLCTFEFVAAEEYNDNHIEMKIVSGRISSSEPTIIGNPYNANFFEVVIEPLPEKIYYKPENRINAAGKDYIYRFHSLVEQTGYREVPATPSDVIHILNEEFKKHLSTKGFVFSDIYPEFFSKKYVDGLQLHRYFKYRFVYLNNKYYLVLDVRAKTCQEDCPCRAQQSASTPARIANTLEIKTRSFATYGASQNKITVLQDIVKQLVDYAFPVHVGDFSITITPNLLNLHDFSVEQKAEEPQLLWDNTDETKTSSVVLDAGDKYLGGLKNYGVYQKPVNKEIHISILAPSSKKSLFGSLISRLNDGSSTFHGGMNTMFGCKLIIVTFIESEESNYAESLLSFFQSESKKTTDLLLVYTSGSADDTDSTPDTVLLPYFTVKASSTTEGVLTQMVDEATLASTEWKDLNLGLGIFAKCGFIPWVLAPDVKMENADIFVGLSYSNLKNSPDRVIGYANVFDHYGKWLFFAGDADSIDFYDRKKLFKKLLKDIVFRYKEQNGSLPKKIQIHYTKKFSWHERQAIIEGVTEEINSPEIYFVSITDTHPVKVFDQNSPDKSFQRGSYWIINDNEMYLSTTGYHDTDSMIVKKQAILGVPKLLQVKVWAYPEGQAIDMNAIAYNLLALTKLNWASTKSYCREPITTKFAGNIAYLTARFKDIEWKHIVNSALRDKPWFL